MPRGFTTSVYRRTKLRANHPQRLEFATLGLRQEFVGGIWHIVFGHRLSVSYAFITWPSTRAV